MLKLPIKNESLNQTLSCQYQMTVDSVEWFSKMSPTDNPQQRCIDSNPEAECFFAQFVGQHSAMRFASSSLQEFLELTQVDNNLCEWMIDSRPRKFYVDWDGNAMTLGPAFLKKGLRGQEVIDTVSEVIEGIVDDFLDELEILDGCEPKIEMCHACDGQKLSFHAVVKNLTFENQEDLKIVADRFLAYIREKTDYEEDSDTYFNVHKHFDPSVYCKNRKMRFLNQNKPSQQRPVRVFGKYSTDPTDHMITYAEGIPVAKIPKAWRKPKFTVKKHNIKMVEDLSSDEELKRLCENTVHRGDDVYENWTHWVWAMCGAGVTPQDIHTFCYEASPSKYNEDSTNGLINGFHQEKTTMGRHTLKAWAKEAGYEVEREVEIEATVQPILREDHLTWVDLLKKWHGKSFSCQDEACIALRKDVSCVVRMIQGGSTVFAVYANDSAMYSLAGKLCLLELFIGPKDALKPITLEKLMTHNPLSFPIYNKLVFQPNPDKVRKNELNIYAGFKAQPVVNVNHDLVERCILRHLREVWAAGDPVVYRYLLSWLAQIIKTPWNRTLIAVVLHSGQGTGKTLICNELIDKVFGRDLAISIEGTDKLTQRFNSVAMGKLFVPINELRSLDENSFAGKFDTMKSLITDPYIPIEKKGMDVIDVDNYMNILLTSNHEHTVRLEADDRRYACFEVSDCHKNDRVYFKALLDAWKEDGAGDHVYSYFLNYPDELMVDVTVIPQTDLRKRMINSSKSNPVRFVEQIDELDVDDQTAIFDMGERRASLQNLYQSYIDWCYREGEVKKYGKKTFLSMIKKSVVSEGSAKNSDNKTCRYCEL
jgi:hypothetical protein